MSSRSVDQNKFEATKKSMRNNLNKLKRTLLNSSSEVVRSMSPKNHLVSPLSFFFIMQEGKAFVTTQRSKQVALSLQNTIINTIGMRRPRHVARAGNVAHKKGYTYCLGSRFRLVSRKTSRISDDPLHANRRKYFNILRLSSLP